MKQAILFLTHKADGDIRKRFEKIKADVGDIADVYVMTDKPYLFGKEWGAIISFARMDVSDLGRTGILTTDMDRARVLLEIVLKNNFIYKYDYYWLIEYDVLFNGNLKELFRKVERDDSDFITTHIKSYEEDLEVEEVFGPSYIFAFWSKMILGTDSDKSIKRFRSFLQFYRISAKAIDKLSKIILNNGWQGHFESLVPTALIHGKMKISQFGGESEFTPKERISLFYNSYPVDTYLGSFRFRPPVVSLNKKGYLYHPVKKIGFYSYCKYVIRGKLAYLRLKIFYDYQSGKWIKRELPPIICKMNKLIINIEEISIWDKIDAFLRKLKNWKY